MSTNGKLYIPKTLRIGLDQRDDCFNKGDLAYAIYYDGKGILRKERSWESWRDKKLEPFDLANDPVEGLVLNKKTGDYKSDWSHRKAHVRLFDPRGNDGKGFEVEITVENLLFLLQCTGSFPGKALEGKFVYAWDGTELVILPENCENYHNALQYTELQHSNVKAADLVPGHTYIKKNQDELVYLGRFKWYNEFKYKGSNYADPYNVYLFHQDDNVVPLTSLSPLSKPTSDIVVPNYADLIEQFQKGPHGSKPVEIYTKDHAGTSNCRKWVVQNGNSYDQWESGWYKHGIYDCALRRYPTEELQHITLRYCITLVNNRLNISQRSGTIYNPTRSNKRISYYNSWGSDSEAGWIEPTNKVLYMKLESGLEIKV